MILKTLIGEYIIVFLRNDNQKPKGFCVYVDDEFLVVQKDKEEQVQMDFVKKFKTPFYIVPIGDIKGIAGMDVENLKEMTHEHEQKQDSFEPPAITNMSSPKRDLQQDQFESSLSSMHVDNCLIPQDE